MKSEVTVTYHEDVRIGSDWKTNEITDDLADYLPHGSGIDLDWQIDVYPNRIVCFNSYHTMDDNGMYAGWVDFSITLPLHLPVNQWDQEFKLTIHGKHSHYLAAKYDLRPYLEDTFAHQFSLLKSVQITTTY